LKGASAHRGEDALRFFSDRRETVLVAKTTKNTASYSNILVLSAWSFAMVICSFVFLYVGYWLDELLNTAPNFMLGLFVLAIFLCVGRLYRDAWIRRG
jgi:F0F1-type ATP synthase assembly protein I